MAATGKTPILLYGSTTATNQPSAGNLTNSSDGCEIAINVADKNLFFKDSTNVVNTVPIRQSSASSNGWLSSTDWTTFNNKSPAAGSSSITTVGTITSGTWHGSTIGTGYGGTGLTSFTANGIVYASSTSALTTGSSLTFDGTNITNSAGVFVSTNGSGGIGYTGSFLTTYRLVNLHASGATQVIGSGEIDIYTAGGSPIVFSTSGAEATRIHSSGGVSIGNTTDPGAANLSVSGNVVIATSGKGIDFSATAGTGTSELLADYEEGTWTPVVQFGSGNTGMSVTTSGRYTKIGRIVTITVDIAFTAKGSSTGNFRFDIPYASGIKASGSMGFNYSWATMPSGGITFMTDGNYAYGMPANYGGYLDDTYFNNGTTINAITITYTV